MLGSKGFQLLGREGEGGGGETRKRGLGGGVGGGGVGGGEGGRWVALVAAGGGLRVEGVVDGLLGR